MRIPSSSVYPSLNLSHTVMVCAYGCSWRLLSLNCRRKVAGGRDSQKERMFAMWERMLLQIGFMEPDKAAHMMQGCGGFSPAGASDDVRILMGIARQMSGMSVQKTLQRRGSSAVAD